MHGELEQQRSQWTSRYGKVLMRAVLFGLAGVSPRSTTPNLVELLIALLTRCVSEAQGWLREIMFDVGYNSIYFYGLVTD